MIGTVKGEFSVELPPIIKQSNFGVLTESGLLKSANSLVVFMEDKTPKQIKTLDTSTSSVQVHLKNLKITYEELEAAQAKGTSNLASMQAKFKADLKDLKMALNQEDYGKYGSTASLHTAQTHFLEFAEFMISRAMDNEEDVKKHLFEALRALMCRKELDLEHVGFEMALQISGLGSGPGSRLAASSSSSNPDKEPENMKIGLKYFCEIISDNKAKGWLGGSGAQPEVAVGQGTRDYEIGRRKGQDQK